MTNKPGPRTAAAWQRSLEQLSDLSHWSYLQQLAERVVMCLQGVDGLTKEDIEALQQWPSRWAALPQRSREFYVWGVKDNNSTVASIVLLKTLKGKPPPEWTIVIVLREYEELFGEKAGTKLFSL